MKQTTIWSPQSYESKLQARFIYLLGIVILPNFRVCFVRNCSLRQVTKKVDISTRIFCEKKMNWKELLLSNLFVFKRNICLMRQHAWFYHIKTSISLLPVCLSSQKWNVTEFYSSTHFFCVTVYLKHRRVLEILIMIFIWEIYFTSITMNYLYITFYRIVDLYRRKIDHRHANYLVIVQ
jgi:hypothetical protein